MCLLPPCPSSSLSLQHLLKYNMRRQGFTFTRAVDVPRMTRATARSYALDVLEASIYTRTASAGGAASAGAASGGSSPVATTA